MNKICPECGKEISENLNACKNCGYRLNNMQSENKKKKMPVWVIILIVGACLLPIIVVLLIVLGVFTKFNTKVNINSGIVLDGQSGYIEITYDEYEEKIDNNEHFVVVISREGCSYCELYKPVVEEVTEEYDIPVYYLDLSHMTNNEYIRLGTSNDYLMENRWGTPTTLYMHGEEVIDAIGGYVDEEELEDFLGNYFIID